MNQVVKIKVCCRCNDFHKNMIEVHRKNGDDFTDITYKCETCKVEIVLRLSFDEGIEQYLEDD